MTGLRGCCHLVVDSTQDVWGGQGEREGEGSRGGKTAVVCESGLKPDRGHVRGNRFCTTPERVLRDKKDERALVGHAT